LAFADDFSACFLAVYQANASFDFYLGHTPDLV